MIDALRKIELNGFRFCSSAFDGLLGFGFWLRNGFSEDTLERIDFILDVVAELEGWNDAFFNLYDITCARITGGPCFARFAGEGAKTANFNGIAFDKFLGHEVKELFDDDLNVIAHKPSGFGDFLNNVLFCNVSHALNIGLSTT